jgi:uncharacterized protein (DUF1800 family)
MRFARLSASVLVVSIVGVGLVGVGPTGYAQSSKSAVPAKPDTRTIVHVLNRLGFGPAPGDIEEVRALGLDKYIEQQLNPERIADAALAERLASYQTLDKSTRELSEKYFVPALEARREAQRAQAAQDPTKTDSTPPDPAARRAMMTPEQNEAVRMEREVLTELMQAKIVRAAYSERQLQEVLVDFWFNHFNVFVGKGQVRTYLSEYERTAIRPHVLGKFRDLLQATAESPAMLFYLDNWQSTAPEGVMTTAQNQRESMPQLPRRRPAMPGTVRPGATARPGQVARPPRTAADLPQNAPRRPRGINENYARELMELHTLGVDGGYTQKDVQEVARAFTGWTIATPRVGGSFRFEPRMHDDGDKIVLGHTIKSGGGKKDGDQILDLLAKHPATARFIATKLARRFVADEPPKALVDRAAATFRETDGDIRQVVRTIVTSPEFFAADAYRAKVKTPFEFIVSAVRATGTETHNAQALVGAVRNLGMPLYGCQPPTGYSDKAEAWVNSGALLNRMNFALSLANGSVRGRGGESVRPLQGRAVTPITVTSDALIASALAGELSESTAGTIAKASSAPQALALVLGSPEFQRR